MSEVGIRALKQNASSVVAQARSGEIVTITDRGRPVAQMTPIPSSRLAAIIAQGTARIAMTDITELTPPEPRSGSSLSAELAARRDDERY